MQRATGRETLAELSLFVIFSSLQQNQQNHRSYLPRWLLRDPTLGGFVHDEETSVVVELQ